MTEKFTIAADQLRAMTDPSALLPCPFCGATPMERFEDNPNGPKYPGHWFVWCENLDCKAGGEAMEENQEAARAAWNTRTPAQAAGDLHDVQVLLHAISDLVDDEDTAEPLDYAIAHANKALAILAALPVPQPVGQPAREALEKVLRANDEFRAAMPEGWEGDPLQDACDEANAVLAALPSSPAGLITPVAKARASHLSADVGAASGAGEAISREEVLSRISVFRDHEPESDETWESWYFAAFDLLRAEVAKMEATLAPPQPAIGPGNPVFEETRAAVTAAREKLLAEYRAENEQLRAKVMDALAPQETDADLPTAADVRGILASVAPQAVPRPGTLTEDQIMQVIRKVTSGELREMLTCKRWKDGIDIDQPTFAAERLAEEFRAAVALSPAGTPGEFARNKAADVIASLRAQLAQRDGELERIDEKAIQLADHLASARKALEQAQDCIRGETPEDMTHEEAIEDTISKIRAVLLTDEKST